MPARTDAAALVLMPEGPLFQEPWYPPRVQHEDHGLPERLTRRHGVPLRQHHDWVGEDGFFDFPIIS